jgi:ribosome maturation factor RimP
MRAGSRHVPVPAGGQGGRAAGRPGSAQQDQQFGQVDLGEIERLAEPVARAAGMELEAVHLTAAGRRRLLKVVVDAVGGVGLDDMALVSQALSAALDAEEIMGGSPYTLEVTSPGVDRPLTRPQHWRRAAGRLVSAPLTGPQHRVPGGDARQTIRGRIVAVIDDGVVVDVEGERRVFGFADLGPGKVQVEFRREDMGESRGH